MLLGAIDGSERSIVLREQWIHRCTSDGPIRSIVLADMNFASRGPKPTGLHDIFFKCFNCKYQSDQDFDHWRRYRSTDFFYVLNEASRIESRVIADTFYPFTALNINPFYTIKYAAVRLWSIIPYTHWCVFTCVSMRATINFLVLPFWKEKRKRKLPMGLCEASFPLPASWGPPF